MPELARNEVIDAVKERVKTNERLDEGKREQILQALDQLAAREDLNVSSFGRLMQSLERVNPAAKKLMQQNFVGDLAKILSDLNGVQEMRNGNDVANANPKIARAMQENPKLANEISRFVQTATKSRLPEGLGDYNFDKWAGEHSMPDEATRTEAFAKHLGQAVEDLVKLGGAKKLEEVMTRINDHSLWVDNIDKAVAHGLNIGTYMNVDGIVSEAMLGVTGISEGEMKKIEDKPFDITSGQSYKELGLMLAKDLSDKVVGGLLKMLPTAPAAIPLIPRYISLRMDANASDSANAAPQAAGEKSPTELKRVSADIELREMTKDFPIFAIPNLAGEQGLAALQELGKLLTLGGGEGKGVTVGAVAKLLVAIGAIIAGWAALTRVVANRVGGMAAEWSQLASGAGAVARTAGRVEQVGHKLNVGEKLENAAGKVLHAEQQVYGAGEKITAKAVKGANKANEGGEAIRQAQEGFGEANDKVPDHLQRFQAANDDSALRQAAS